MARKLRRSPSMVREAPASYAVQLAPRGRLVLPAGARRRLGLKEGDRLILTTEEDGSVRLRSAADVARSLQGLYRHLAPGRRLSDELIRERRRDARREEEE